MKLKSFGCSFVWGNELIDSSNKWSNKLIEYNSCSNLTYAALLAQHLDLEYECFAQPGVGNLVIAEQILNQVGIEPAVFVINWTYIDRFDYTAFTIDFWRTLRPGNVDPVTEYYYKKLHSQYRDKLTTLINIKICIDALIAANHPFVMTYMDHLIFETKWHTSPAILKLQESIRPHLKTWAGKNLSEYSEERGHEFGVQGHPLRLAHKDLFDYALQNFGIDKIQAS